MGVATGVRAWNALAGPLGWGYDAWGHVAYVLFLDLYRALPHADQGWVYFHPPLHYLLAWPWAWPRSGEVLLRGMLLLSSAASLLTAAVAAWVVRRSTPLRPELGWLAFAALALLPAHLTASAMPGNESSAALFASLAVAHFVATGERERDALLRDLGTGVLLGLALLVKHSAWVAVAAVFASLATWACLAAPRGLALRRAALRSAAIALGTALVAGPLIARNLAESGTPIPFSHEDPWMHAAESGQPPGVRTLRHYLRVPPALFQDANPLSPHLLGSVWGSLYANVWYDNYRESDRDRTLQLQRGTPRPVRALLGLGLLPTGLALAGAGLALRDVVRGRRRAVYVPLLWLAAGMLLAQALFAWQIPTWAAIKATYLLPASLSFAVFLVRGWEGLAASAPQAGSAALAGLGATALLSAFVNAEGSVAPRRIDAPAAGATYFYFGEYDASRRVFEALAARSSWPVPWLDNLAATHLAAGDAALARDLYRRAVTIEATLGRGAAPGPLMLLRRGQLAVASALVGDAQVATALLDASLEQLELPELRANRGVLLARAGRLPDAEADLRRALAADAEMLPAWEALAVVLGRMQRQPEAREALTYARQVACRTPRGYPRGIGSGENVEWGVGRRWLLRLDADDDGLRVELPADRRGACARLTAAR